MYTLHIRPKSHPLSMVVYRYRQVRNMVGMLVDVGLGHISPDDVSYIIKVREPIIAYILYIHPLYTPFIYTLYTHFLPYIRLCTPVIHVYTPYIHLTRLFLHQG